MNTRYIRSYLRTTIAVFGSCLLSTAAMATPPINSAYSTDIQNSHVEDATSEGIGQVNMITCIMQSMRPDALVNQGNYIALVDENKCSANKSSSSNSTGGDASQASNYTTTVVNSTRSTNLDPMRVKVWLNEEDQGQASTIFVNISATAAPTTANPYGQFRLDFCGKGDTGACQMNGMLQGADGALDYYQTEQRGNNESSTTALRLTSVGTTTGSGKLDTIQTQGTDSSEAAFLFAYDATHFLRRDQHDDQCFSRDATDPNTGFSVWNYGMYDSVTGDRINLNSGFPINYTVNGTTYNGFIGYWGMNMPSAAGLTNGATVQKVDYSSNTPTTTNYTVVLASGKLTKYIKKSKKLHEIDKVQINTWVNDATDLFSGATSNTQYVMYWNDATSKFVITGQMNCDQNGCNSRDLDAPQNVSPAFWTQQGLQGNSQSLGGDVYIDLKNIGSSIDSTTISVVYHAQDIVYPSDMPAHLYCVSNCPTDSSLNDYLTGSSPNSPYDSTTFNRWNPSATYITYTSDTTAGVMKTNGNAVTATDMNTFQQYPQYQGGVRSGRLVTDPNSLLCGDNVYCDYKANDQDVYYMWETGPNNWNQFAAIKDNNNDFVKFDPPMQVNYTVPNDVTHFHQYAGKTIVLQYGGFGNLGGIPGNCVSSLTNQPVSCNQENARYVPDFVIPYDTTLGQVSDGTHAYLMKWLDREIRFASKPLADCSALSLPSNVTLPTSAVLKDPSDSTSDIYIGIKPTVTGQPRVIQGEVMY